MDRPEAFKSIAAQAGRGELTFPTNVNATLKLQQALSDPELHADDAARLVQAEPLLAARTVAIANSVAYTVPAKPSPTCAPRSSGSVSAP
jgi:HD-like signal output (HDOD) protein